METFSLVLEAFCGGPFVLCKGDVHFSRQCHLEAITDLFDASFKCFKHWADHYVSFPISDYN